MLGLSENQLFAGFILGAAALTYIILQFVS
jgi:hypothetical protein